MKRLFHLAIGGTILGKEAVEGIEQLLNNGASDWYRQGTYSWMIYAAGPLNDWRDLIRAIPGMQGSTSFMLMEFDPRQVAGYLLDDTWNWLKKYGRD